MRANGFCGEQELYMKARTFSLSQMPRTQDQLVQGALKTVANVPNARNQNSMPESESSMPESESSMPGIRKFNSRNLPKSISLPER